MADRKRPDRFAAFASYRRLILHLFSMLIQGFHFDVIAHSGPDLGGKVHGNTNQDIQTDALYFS